MRADRVAAFAVLLIAPLLGGCYASNVVATQDRAVVEQALPTEWRPATAADLQGLFATEHITGDAALSLRAVHYWFERDGRWSGAALVDSDGGPLFQTLGGRWRLTPEGLVLDDNAPARCDAAPGWLRIATPGGELVLHRQVAR